MVSWENVGGMWMTTLCSLNCPSHDGSALNPLARIDEGLSDG